MRLTQAQLDALLGNLPAATQGFACLRLPVREDLRTQTGAKPHRQAAQAGAKPAGPPKERKVKPREHYWTRAKCISCHHTWRAHTGTRLWFKCPNCGNRSIREIMIRGEE